MARFVLSVFLHYLFCRLLTTDLRMVCEIDKIFADCVVSVGCKEKLGQYMLRKFRSNLTKFVAIKHNKITFTDDALRYLIAFVGQC